MPAVPTAVPWLLGALGLAMAILRGVRTYRFMVSPNALAAIVIKQVGAGALDRIQKIFVVIPETALGAAMSAANRTAMELQEKDPPPSEDAIRAAMRASYEPAFDAAVRPLFVERWMAVLSAVAGVAAVLTALTQDPPIHFAAGLGVLALVATALNVRGAQKVIGAARFLDDVLPTYVATIRNRISTMKEPKETLEKEKERQNENPYRLLQPIAPSGDDPRGWAATLESILYGFDARSPDLFYEIVVVPFAKEIGALRTTKLRREGSPRFVVAVFGPSEALRRFRDKVEAEAPARYASCTTPAAEIAPDASYGPETRTRSQVLDELRKGTLDVVATGKDAAS
jgi:hypothetical protein